MRIALLAAAALAVSATPALARTKSFQTPSHNIYCLYMSTQGPGPWIRCDVLSLNDVGFRIDKRHKGRKIHITDSVFHPRRQGPRLRQVVERRTLHLHLAHERPDLQEPRERPRLQDQPSEAEALLASTRRRTPAAPSEPDGDERPHCQPHTRQVTPGALE